MCVIPDDNISNSTFIIYYITFSATLYFHYNRNRLSNSNQYINVNICDIYLT